LQVVTSPARSRWFFRSTFSWRSAGAQALFLAAIGYLLFEAFVIGRANMQAHHIPTDFGFLEKTSGFDINQTLISYSAASTYARAFFVGLLNTLIVAAIGLVFATILGFGIGIARLSQNLAVAKLALVYVEAIRNVPLLLQLLFWYNAVLKPMPPPEASLVLPGGVFLNNRGLVLPEPILGAGALWVAGALLAGLITAFVFWRSARRSRQQGGLLTIILITFGIALLPAIAAAVWDAPVTFIQPELGRYNFDTGWHIRPEFIALLIGLSTYTASFIAEIVRAGMNSVPKGLTEAAAALGLQLGQALRFITLPLALRVIIPPLTSQYVNLVKNSSLAVFIGYPDLVQVFAGTVLNQTGAAVQVMGLTMAVYLALSLSISAAMNLFNRRLVRQERG
jgi:general L-amino acid transport system permease protein